MEIRLSRSESQKTLEFGERNARERGLKPADVETEIAAVRADRILECAVASQSEYLVTGDNHLLKLGHFDGTKIVKPADFLKIHAQSARNPK